MKTRLLMASVALPLVVLSNVSPARAEDDGCGGMNWFQCQASRAAYAISHIGQPDPPPAKLTTTPVTTTPTTPAAPAVATADQLDAGRNKINDLLLTGVIDADTAA